MSLTVEKESFLSFLNVIAARHPNWFHFSEHRTTFSESDLDTIDFKKVVHCIENGQSYEVRRVKSPPPLPPKRSNDNGDKYNIRSSTPTRIPSPVMDKLVVQKKPIRTSYLEGNDTEVTSFENLINDDESADEIVEEQQQDNVNLIISPIINPNIIRQTFSTFHMRGRSLPHAELPFDSDPKWSQDVVLTDDNRRMLAYENLILATGMFRKISANDLATILSNFRIMLKISDEEHSNLLVNLLMEDMTIHISTSLSSEIFKTLTPSDKLPQIFFETHLLSRRMDLIQDMEDNESKKRNIWLMLNILVLVFRRKGKFEYSTQNIYEKKIVTDEIEFRKMITVCFENTLADVATDADNNLIAQLKVWIQDNCSGYPYPLSIQLYQPFMNMTVQACFDDDEDDNDDFGDDKDDGFEELHTSLAPLREMLGMKDCHAYVMFLEALCQRFSKASVDSDEEAHFIDRIHNILMKIESEPSILTSDPNDINFKMLFDESFIGCFDAFGEKLMNYTQLYGNDDALLKDHLDVFTFMVNISTLIYKDCDYKEQLSNYIPCIIRSAAIHNYSTLKGEKQISERIFPMIEFEKQLQEEIQLEHSAMDALFSELYLHCHLEYDFAMCGLLYYDVAIFIHRTGELNADVLQLYEILGERWTPQLCSVLNPGDKTIPEYLKWEEILLPLTVISTPLLDAWIQKIDQLFHEYLSNSLQLEKWTSISKDALYTTSAVDVISFLERSFSILHRIKLPIVKGYIHKYVELCCSMIEEYCNIMAQPYPSALDLRPNPPSIKKTKTKSLFSKKISLKPTIEDVRYEEEERQRILFGDQFSIVNLFLRCNNLIFLRDKLPALLARATENWIETVENVFCNITSDKQISFENLLKKTAEVLKGIMRKLVDFTSTRIVFIHLWKRIFYNQIYYESVPETRLTRILNQELDPVLSMIVENIQDQHLAQFIIRNVYKHVVVALEYVILDGGDHRIFYIQDYEAILDDINALMTYFFQDGCGISNQEFLLNVTVRLRSLVDTIMKLPTEEIIKNLETGGRFHDIPDTSENSIFTKLNIYKVLYHRRIHDKIARKYLSKTPLPVKNIIHQTSITQKNDPTNV